MILAKNELNMEVEERSISRAELYSADEVFFSGTAMEVTPVIEIDNRKIGSGVAGNWCKDIKELFFDITRGKSEKYGEYCTPVY